MPSVEQMISELIQQAANRYFRLVLVVGSPGSGKTAALKSLSTAHGHPYINLNLTLSQKLLDIPRKSRTPDLPQIIREIITAAKSGVVLLDNTEILFDPSLQHDPLRCLQFASRNQVIVAAWNGKVQGRTVTYAEPGHPEYRRYTDVDALIAVASKS